MHVYIINWRVVHRQYLCNCLLSTHNLLVGWNKCPIGPRDDGYRQRRKSWVACGTTCAWSGRGMSAALIRPWRKSLHHRKTAVRDTLNPIHILHSTVNVGSTNTFCRQKLDYCALSLFGGIHGTIVNCYLASASVNNTLPLSSVYQISPNIHCHLRGKSQSSTAGNNGEPTSVPLSLGHALYLHGMWLSSICVCAWCSCQWKVSRPTTDKSTKHTHKLVIYA